MTNSGTPIYGTVPQKKTRNVDKMQINIKCMRIPSKKDLVKIYGWEDLGQEELYFLYTQGSGHQICRNLDFFIGDTLKKVYKTVLQNLLKLKKQNYKSFLS